MGEIITSEKNFRTANQIHLKYVDDMTIAEAIKLMDALVSVPDKPFTDNFHARTGHALSSEKSNLYKQLFQPINMQRKTK